MRLILKLGDVVNVLRRLSIIRKFLLAFSRFYGQYKNGARTKNINFHKKKTNKQNCDNENRRK